MSTHADPLIHRRPDGSIDFEHYDRIARRRRAHDQRAALKMLIAPVSRMLSALRFRPSTRRQSPLVPRAKFGGDIQR
ncbi:hypothetical protein C2I36_05280 [Rhodobacteraceae bacterium WD3A24]|nr:hypothetical protein C2I36_05280 [Rhodobacteraceae bacterium WD3A24]